MAAQIILSLSILVGIHEFGHMIAARFFGMRVEQFSIGFPPKIFGVKKGETEYSIGSIPLGGFVKISGMVDESLDTDKLKEEPQPWEFRAKPAWQRLIVMLGGIIMNVLTGIVIFIILTYSLGEAYIPKEEFNEHGIVALDLGEEVGFQTGDKIINVNGKDFKGFIGDGLNVVFSEENTRNIIFDEDAYYTVQRNGETEKITIPGNFLERLSENELEANFILPRTFARISTVNSESPAEEGGLQAGDIITMVNGDTTYYNELSDIIKRNANEVINLTVKRPADQTPENPEYTTESLKVEVGADSLIGIAHSLSVDQAFINYSFGESLVQGTEKAFDAVIVNVKAFGKILSGELSPAKSISGPIGIARVFGGTWDWVKFWSLTGLLSMVLAFMNLLPIPALDGGHVVFLSYEIISGRPPSDKFLEASQKVGMVLLLCLMVFAFGNDIYKSIFY